MPILCKTWKAGNSFLRTNEQTLTINASPFSQPCNQLSRLSFASSQDELKSRDCAGKILVLGGDLVSTPLQPKNYPFYYPDEHKNFIDLLEKKLPLAIIATTGRHPLCGLDPYPLFDDGNFLIPSAYAPEKIFAELQCINNESLVHLSINSITKPRKSNQLVATKKAPKAMEKIVICAHMDTKYHTRGALDNAVGIAVLLEVANQINIPNYNIDIVPFNGEEYYEASGEVEYLKYTDTHKDSISLVVNIDSPCHIGSEIAVSLYNFKDDSQKMVDCLIKREDKTVYGSKWYAGDHSTFAQRGIPCVAISSSNLFNGALNDTHTMRDTELTIDLSLIRHATKFVLSLISGISQIESPL